MISGKKIRQILCLAIRNKVLIVTKTDDDARAIRNEIADFVRIYLSPDIRTQVHSTGVNIGGYEPFLVYDLKRWNAEKRAYPFSGVLIVTDESISGINNIAEGTKKWLLPLEVKK